jgi:hypothetical protein
MKKSKERSANWRKTGRKDYNKSTANIIITMEEMVTARTTASIKAGIKRTRIRIGRKEIMIETEMMTEKETGSK